MAQTLQQQQLIDVLNINKSINITIPNEKSFIVKFGDNKPELKIPISIVDFNVSMYKQLMDLINRYASVKMQNPFTVTAATAAISISDYGYALLNATFDPPAAATAAATAAAATAAAAVTAFEAAAATAGGKRSGGKSKKNYPSKRDEHGRFLPSNKRKNGRQRRTARRPMSDKNDTENTMLMASLV